MRNVYNNYQNNTHRVNIMNVYTNSGGYTKNCWAVYANKGGVTYPIYGLIFLKEGSNIYFNKQNILNQLYNMQLYSGQSTNYMNIASSKTFKACAPQGNAGPIYTNGTRFVLPENSYEAFYDVGSGYSNKISNTTLQRYFLFNRVTNFARGAYQFNSLTGNAIIPPHTNNFAYAYRHSGINNVSGLFPYCNNLVGAFEACDYIKNASVSVYSTNNRPTNLYDMFNWCYNLQRINVYLYGQNWALQRFVGNCLNLTNVYITQVPQYNESYGPWGGIFDDSFYNCPNLRTLHINLNSGNNTALSASTYPLCIGHSNLTTLVLKDVGFYTRCFTNCPNLRYVYLHANHTDSMGYYKRLAGNTTNTNNAIFNNCPNIDTFWIDSNISGVSSTYQFGNIFRNHKNIKHLFIGNNAGNHIYDLDHAFDNCTNLTSYMDGYVYADHISLNTLYYANRAFANTNLWSIRLSVNNNEYPSSGNFEGMFYNARNVFLGSTGSSRYIDGVLFDATTYITCPMCCNIFRQCYHLSCRTHIYDNNVSTSYGQSSINIIFGSTVKNLNNAFRESCIYYVPNASADFDYRISQGYIRNVNILVMGKNLSVGAMNGAWVRSWANLNNAPISSELRIFFTNFQTYKNAKAQATHTGPLYPETNANSGSMPKHVYYFGKYWDIQNYAEGNWEKSSNYDYVNFIYLVPNGWSL